MNTNGDIYVKLERLKDGKGIIVLRESGGKAQVVNSFGNFAGSGIAIKNGYLYATTDDEVFRYKFNEKNEIDPNQEPEKIICRKKELANNLQYKFLFIKSSATSKGKSHDKSHI